MHVNSADRIGDAEALSALAQALLRREQQLGRQMTRALHDRLGQSLAAIRLYLGLLRPGASVPSRDSLQRDIDHIDKMLDQAITGVREMLAELSPPLLVERGLVAALDNETRRRTASAAADVLLEAGEAVRGVRWPPDVEYGAFMIAREAVDKAVRNGHASLVRVLLAGDGGRLELAVLDDGRVKEPADGGRGTPSLETTAMRERARGIAAHLEWGAAEGGGNRVSLHWEAPAT